MGAASFSPRRFTRQVYLTSIIFFQAESDLIILNSKRVSGIFILTLRYFFNYIFSFVVASLVKGFKENALT